MTNFPSIQSFFLFKPTSDTSSPLPPGDGFLTEEKQSSTKDAKTYQETPIASLKLGMGLVSICGKIVNFREHETGSSKSEAAKVLLKMLIKDHTSIIEVRAWLPKPISAYNELHQLAIGRVCKIQTSFVGSLDPLAFQKSSSTVPLFISIPGNSVTSQILLCRESDEENLLSKQPPGVEDGNLAKILPLESTVTSDMDLSRAPLLVCVKFVGARKRVAVKDGRAAEKVEVGIFDETKEGSLILWGSMCASANSWRASETILLITSPAIAVWSQKPQLTVTNQTLIEVNPDIRDAKWLRQYAKKLLKQPIVGQPFPENEFPWRQHIQSSMRLLYTLADIDEIARKPATVHGQYIGYISLMILELNLTTMFKRKMFMCGNCCGVPVYANTEHTQCGKCERKDVSLQLNPRILGTVADETGCINGGNLLLSDRAATKLLQRPLAELIKDVDVHTLQQLEYHLLFKRLTVIFGWSKETRKLAVWEIQY